MSEEVLDSRESSQEVDGQHDDDQEIAHSTQDKLARPEGASGHVLSQATGAGAAEVVAQVQLLGEMTDATLTGSDLGAPYRYLLDQFVYLVLDR